MDDPFPSGDLFSSAAPPHRLETTVASPRRERPSAVYVAPVWTWASPVRAAITLVLFAGGAAWFVLPGWQVVAFPSAAIACQCVRRWAVLRWSAWSVVLAAFGASVLLLGTWPLRFAACLLLVGPFVFVAGSELRRF